MRNVPKNAKQSLVYAF